MFAITMTQNRLVVMRRTSTLTFISVFCLFALGSSNFHFINLKKSYEESKSYCRERNTDLATIQNSADMNSLITLVSNLTPRAWIGLEIGDIRMWHWSLPDQTTDFFNWKAGEPKDNDEDACAAMDPDGKWFESDCTSTSSFVCHGGGDASGPIFVAQKKSWRNAQSHCRGLSSELVSIQSAEENRAVHDVSRSQNVWIGLFKDPWKWSDGSNSSFRFWRPNQPNYYNNNQECTAAIFTAEGQWNDLKCSVKRNFICRGALKPIPTTITTQNSSQGGSTTNQGTTNSSQVTITYHFTVATNNQSNTTNVTTAASTTAPTTLNTTNSASQGSSTELNTPTATTQPPPETTLNATTLATPNGTSTQNTTQSSPPNLHPETLILIQDNLTWMDAMSYCRRHHIDLVHITTEDIQDKVAEKAKNATTAHVWLGLRYTCKFKFWFWTKSTSGCYQNWVEGEGSDVEYECGVSGAIEATGRQQWVGLNEMERLNFICYTCAG